MCCCIRFSQTSRLNRFRSWLGWHLRCRGRLCGWEERGQATIEAAFLLPLVLVLLLVLLQPAIFLYNRAIMGAAAAEGCRLLATAPAGQEASEKYTGFIKRRLGAIPPLDIFHVHKPCSWEITCVGSEGSGEVSVTIKNAVKPLPLVGGLWALGLPKDGAGRTEMVVEVSSQAMPLWTPPEGQSVGRNTQ